MADLKQFEVWFITGSQSLYGEETLKQVADHTTHMVNELEKKAHFPVTLLCKPIVKSSEEIWNLIQEVNTSRKCVGIITWMHTFSPAKMWINGLKILQKPLLHLHTQFNRDIPWSTIDMDFMNLNQSAHGDREFGFIMSRMKLRRKVVVGHWEDRHVHAQMETWMRAACAWQDWQGSSYCRFGDNMRHVAVTEGDKVEAHIQFGFAVNGYGVGDLVQTINTIADKEIDQLTEEYAARYEVQPALRKGGAQHASLRTAAKIELGMEKFLLQGNFSGFTDTFEDLHGLEQLPGIAVQRLMAKGYGFGAEGDWKTAALVRAMKVMGAGLPGGNSFMEDYTYHFDPVNSQVLGAHMLEICPSIAQGRPTCEIHPLGIGGKADPVRLVFNSGPGPALNASLIDLGNRFRLLINEVQAIEPEQALPNLPVARVLWKPLPDMSTACAAWIHAGGAHHTCYSQNLTAAHLYDFAEMASIEFVSIDGDTSLPDFQSRLRWNAAGYQ